MPINYRAFNYLKLSSYIFILAVGLASCDCSSSRVEQQQQEKKSSGTSQEKLMNAQREYLKKERESIKAYLNDRNLEMERTGTGLYYEVLEDSNATKSVETEDVVEFEYDIYMMNGHLLYSSEESGNRRLKIDKEDAEIGLHESLKYLGLGDKGRFILPSHLAYGVAGDQEKVPPFTPLVYELKVVNIKKSKS